MSHAENVLFLLHLSSFLACKKVKSCQLRDKVLSILCKTCNSVLTKLFVYSQG